MTPYLAMPSEPRRSARALRHCMWLQETPEGLRYVDDFVWTNMDHRL